MTRSNKTQRSQINRRAIRLALCIALTGNAACALADDTRGTGLGSTALNSSMDVPELPAYPFPIQNSVAPVTQNSVAPVKQHSQARSSKQVLSRLLGYTSKSKQADVSLSVPATLPTLEQPVALVLPQLLQPTAVPLMPTDLVSAQAMIEHPASDSVALETQAPVTEPELKAPTPSLHLAVGSKPAMALDSNVIVAGATRLAKPVEESFSDSHESSESSDSNGSLVDDLVNSMVSSRQAPAVTSTPPAMPTKSRQEQGSSGFTDTIRMDVADEPEAAEPVRESISMSMSDHSDTSEAATSDSPKPSLVNTRQSLALRTSETAESNSGRLTDSVQPTKLETVSQLPLLKTSPNSLAQQAGTQSAGNLVTAGGEAAKRVDNPTFDMAVQAAVSSRREVTTASNLETRPETGNATSRLPLVPLLASVPIKPTTYSEPQALQAVPTQGAAKVPASSQLQSAPTKLPQAPTQTPVSGRESAAGKEFRVGIKDSVAVQSIENIQALSVEHEEVCQIIQSGPKSFTVVGLQDGETRVAVISEVDGQRKVQVHKIVVGTPKNTMTTNPATLASEVSQTVAQLYPRSRVRITPRGSQLVVSGTVDSEDTAKKILSLVRKTTLNPVIDELQTK